MSIRIAGAARRLLLPAVLALGGLPLAAQAYTYTVLIDSDNNPATGCSVATANGTVNGVDARLDASVSFEPLQVQSQSLQRCTGGSFGAAQNIPGSHPVGVDRGPGPSDVVELGVDASLVGTNTTNTWNLTFVASSPLLGAADAAGPVAAAGLGLPAPVPRPAVIPAAGVWSLMLLCLALGLAAAWTLRRHPGLMLAALMVGALSSAGIAWAAGYLLDGEIGDWDVAALLTDPAGDTTQPEPQVDIRGVFAAREGNRVFFRFDVTEMRLPVLVPPFLNTSFSVNENSPNNTVVGSINAAPGGLSTLLRFNLAAQTPSAGFSVDNATGEIRVADSSQLDFETRPSFTLDVVVTLQGAPGFSLSRQVTVSLNNVNEAPQVAAQSFNIFENSANGTVVGTVVASDPDAGANGQLSYSVVGGSGQTVFAINAASGQITLGNAAALNLANSPYTLQVQVSDGGTPALSASATMTITVNDVNDAPSFTPGPSPVTVLEDSAPYSAAWATAISDGDGGTQTLSFEFTANSNPALFATAPAISPTGVLSFTLAPNANGSANLGVRLRDNGGTANGGVDVSPVANFTITATAVNDAPSFTIPAAAPPVLEGAGPQSVANFATAISAGPADEAGQTLSFAATVTGSTGNLAFAAAPALSPTGTLTYAPQAGTSGTATVSVVLSDNGGTANGGVDTSAPQTFTISVNNVNDAPSFTPGPSPISVLEDSGAYSAAWATNINDNDGGIQALSFVVLSNSNPSLFATAPAISPTGVLSFLPAADGTGVATLSVVLRDDGGTANGGVDQSPAVTLVLNVIAVNDAPSFTIPAAAPPVLEGAGPQSVANFATAISAGPPDEAGQTLSFAATVTGSTGNLAFASAPALSPAGTLTYAPQAGTSGTATVSVVLSDNGGTTNGGVDTSAPQTFTITVNNINDAPSFTPGPSPLVVLEDSGAYSAVWATNINDNDGGIQTLNFELSAGAVTGGLAFTTAPSLSPTGVLSFTAAPDSNGTATFSVVLRDNGGTANGGVDASAPVPLVIEVGAVNDAPSFSVPGSAPSVLENAGAQSVAGFASGMSAGPANEAGQTLNFLVNVTGSTGNLAFSAPPAIDPATGTLTYTAAADTFGVATVSVRLQDNGGTANGGVDTSAAQTFTLEVLFVNNAPTFVGGGNVSVNEDSGNYNAAWATAIDDGDPGISQVLNFVVLSNDNPGLFAASPGVNASTGNLSFVPAANANGVANLTVELRDNGGTANGGVDVSAPVSFSITVVAVNDPPTVTAPANVAVHRHIGIAIGAAHPANLLANVSDVDGPGAAPFTATAQTDAPTAQNGRVSVAPDGSWTYAPPASETLTADSFSFQVCDSGVPAPPACTTATATLALAGEAIWFVNDDAAAGGDGTLARPFQTLAAAAAAASANTKIFKFSGTYTGSATLKNGQQLIGQGASGAFDTLFGIAPPAHAVPRPTLGGARPQLATTAPSAHAITLGSGNTVRGIEIGNTTGAALLGVNVGPLTLGENRIFGSGQALSLANGTVTEVGGAAFTEISSSSGANNISLSAIGGTLDLGSGVLSGASGTAFAVDAGAATISYAGSITAGSGQRPLSVANRTGGVLSLRGAVSSSQQGVSLSNNGGSTIRFSGGLTLTTAANAAFSATGGGTVEICDEEPCNPAATGALVNTLSTTTGVPLQVLNTTIGANGLELRSISANGAPNGIVLTNTGTVGGLSVKGNGGECNLATPTCSGGRIQAATGAGISASATRNLSLSRLRIDAGQDHGINGVNVVGLSLDRLLVQNNGNASGENGINLVELTGTAALSNTTVSGSHTNNIRVANTAGNLGAFNATALTISGNHLIDGNDGVLFDLSGTAVVIASISGSTFSAHKGDHLQFAAANSAGGSISFTGNTLSGGHPSPLGQGITLNAATGVPGYSGSVDYVLSNNTINGAVTTAIVSNLGTSSSAALFRGRIENNQIGSSGVALSCSAQANGVTASARGNGTHTARVANNVIRQCYDRGILSEAGDGSGVLNLTVVGNIVDQQVGPDARESFQSNYGISSSNVFGLIDAPTICLDLGGPGVLANTFSNGPGAPDDFRLRKRFGATVRLPGYAGSNQQDVAAMAQVVAFVEGRNSTTPPNSAAATGTGGGYTGGAACPLPP